MRCDHDAEEVAIDYPGGVGPKKSFQMHFEAAEACSKLGASGAFWERFPGDLPQE